MRCNIWMLITLITVFCNVTAQPAMRVINFDNRSSHDVYVWVTAAVGVTVPSVTSLPYQVVDIKPTTTAKLNYAYTRQWDDKTILTLTFCTTNSQSCIAAVGEYSTFSFIPNAQSSSDWRVTAAWSGLVFPDEIKDNIFELDRQTWNRDKDFPTVVVFRDAHKKYKY